uniref:Sigma factor n=1 Tax=California macrophylla TaxID=337344 RepID=A0A0G2SY81_9ROSI|nr:sigma factor [California macrophylla]
MAIPTVCSSSPNCSPTLSTISLPSLKTLQPLHFQSLPSPTSKFGLTLLSNDALAIAAASETVALANAALEAARDAAMEAAGTGDVRYELERNGFDGLDARRKRRRKRRKGWEEKENVEVPLIIGSVRSGHLTRKQEAQFCMCLKEGARLEAERRKIAASLEHEPSLEQLARAMGMKRRSIHNILRNTRESQKSLIRAYQGLIFSIANSYQGKGLSLQDLVQEGSIGLLRGAERFDPKRGCKLSTYVYWWIRQAITRAIANRRPIRLPGKVRNLLAKIVEAKETLSSRLRRLPSHDEVAELLDVPVFTVKLVWAKSRPPTSLDHVIMTERGRVKLQDIVSDPYEITPEEMVNKHLIKEELEKVLGTLSTRESRILRLRYGLDGLTPKSCDEIGCILNLSRERIRQISIEALMKLQQSSLVDNLKMLYIV